MQLIPELTSQNSYWWVRFVTSYNYWGLLSSKESFHGIRVLLVTSVCNFRLPRYIELLDRVVDCVWWNYFISTRIYELYWINRLLTNNNNFYMYLNFPAILELSEWPQKLLNAVNVYWPEKKQNFTIQYTVSISCDILSSNYLKYPRNPNSIPFQPSWSNY